MNLLPRGSLGGIGKQKGFLKEMKCVFSHEGKGVCPKQRDIWRDLFGSYQE